MKGTIWQTLRFPIRKRQQYIGCPVGKAYCCPASHLPRTTSLPSAGRKHDSDHSLDHSSGHSSIFRDIRTPSLTYLFNTAFISPFATVTSATSATAPTHRLLCRTNTCVTTNVMPPYSIMSPATMVLHKRDNMGFQMAPSLIIFLVILGAGGAVCCGFAIFRFYSGDPADDTRFNRSAEQDAYMREVRERTFRKLPNLAMRGPSYFPNGNLSHAPISPR